jgi:Flp pilus assembly protein CpaB
MTAVAVAAGRVRSRLDTRVVVGVVLVALSIVGGMRLTRSPAPGSAVFVAASDLDPGHVLTRADLATVEVRAPAGVLSNLERVHGPSPVGRVVRTPVPAGAVISAGALGHTLPAGREVTIPVTPEHALGGAIRAGDRVDVYATFDKGTDAARTITVARRAVVQSVTRSDGLFGEHAGAISALTLATDPDAAIGVAFAARNGDLDVVRARGTVPTNGRERFDADTLR